jgi:hypothetical protein
MEHTRRRYQRVDHHLVSPIRHLSTALDEPIEGRGGLSEAGGAGFGAESFNFLSRCLFSAASAGMGGRP